MKKITIPITERQLGWIIFGIFMGLIELLFRLTFNEIKYNQDIFMGLIVGLNIFFIFIAFNIDGRHDTNPIHWIGYCLRLKEPKPND